MRTKTTWLLLLPLVATLVWAGAGPSQADGPSVTFLGVEASGCNPSDWSIDVNRAGFDSDPYLWHTEVTAGGKVYMNEGGLWALENGQDAWSFYPDWTYAAPPNPGAWPLTPGEPMTVRLTAERPRGTVVAGLTLTIPSCDGPAVTYAAADLDGDRVADGSDSCPRVVAATTDGCPVQARSLTLRSRRHHRLAGRLSAVADPAFAAGRAVTVWKVRPGPDRKVATRTTSALGRFRVVVGRGRYYATTDGAVVPTSGSAPALTSRTVRMR